MTESHITRRETLKAVSLASATLLSGVVAATPAPTKPEVELTETGDPPMTVPAALAGQHTAMPLPFAPAALKGISARLISSHHENNYGGAVRNLNRAELELARITADTPAFVVAALRERELTFRNSKSLHEAYFANLGGDGRRAGAIEKAIERAYGTTTRWEQHARATAMGLGGGSGWVVLALELDTGALRTVACTSHAQALGTSLPLLVLDMYEHSYQMDFGAAVARYVEAFFANVSWAEVDRRFELALRMSALLRGGRT